MGQVYKEYERRLLAADAADFGNLLLKAVELLRQDERLSSYEAKSRQPANSSKRNHGGAIDSIAATVILEHWLQEQAG